MHPDDDDPTMFPDSQTRRLSEQFAYGPLDQEAIDRREAQTHAAEYAAAQIEAVIRHPLLAEREHTHGNFSATALIAQRFKDVSKSTPNWNANLTDVQRESLERIFTKIARILSGDPNHKDHWSDIAGGAHLVEEQLP
jgi:hypothetical protein